MNRFHQLLATSIVTITVGTANAQTILLSDIIVSANRAPTEAAKTGSSVSVITAEDLKAEGRTLLIDYLKRLPGVSLSQTGFGGNSSLYIRGASQNYVAVRINGIDVTDPSELQTMVDLATLTVADVARIEVLRGSQSALYGGEAVGGVINITTNPAAPGFSQRLSLEAGSFGTLRGVYALSQQGENTDLSLAISHLQTNGISAAEERDGNSEADGFEVTRISAGFGHAVSGTTRVFGNVFRQDARADYDNGFPIGDADYHTTRRNHGALLGLEFALAGVESRATVEYTHANRAFFDDFPYEATGERVRLDYLGQMTLSETLGLSFGFDHAFETSSTPLTTYPTTTIFGGFAQLSYTPSDQWTATLALRHDQHSTFGGFQTGRATLAYQVSDATTLRASFGTGFRAPSINELFGPFGSNPDLGPEKSRSMDIGIDHRFDGGQVSLSLFDLRITDEIAYLWPTGYEQVPGTSKRRGIELTAEYALSERTRINAAYTMTEAKDRIGARLNMVPRHDLSASLTHAFTARLSGTLSGHYVADTLDSGTPLGDYFLTDARLFYALSDTVDLSLRVENIGDVHYQTTRGYGTPGRAAYLGLEARF